MIRSLVVVALLVASVAVPKKIPPCPGGRYLLDPGDAGLIFGDQTPKTDAITVGATSLATPTCGETHAKPKGTKNGTVVHGKWKTCGSFKKVATKATITDDCAVMQGTIKAKKVPVHSFTAHLSTGCGDGLLDAGLGEQCEVDGDCTAPGATCSACTCAVPSTTTTTSPGVSTTTTATTSSTTTTLAGCQPSTTAENACGNCVVDPGETCDDGNTEDGDHCPHDCVIQSCAALPDSTRTFSVNFAPPAGVSIAGIQILVDYPEGAVSIPGSGNDASVISSITHVPFGRISSPNDLDYALVEGIVGSSGITPGRLFTITFQDCDGATAPVPANFSCVVTDASDAGANSVDPSTVSCTVVSP
jgi:cysteine-rich repeat protein